MIDRSWRRAVMALALGGALAVTPWACAPRSAETPATAGDPDSARADAAAEARLRQIDADMDSLGRRAERADRRLREGIVQRLEALRTQRDSTAAWLERVRAGGREAWRGGLVGVDSALGGLERGIGHVRGDLRAHLDSTRH